MPYNPGDILLNKYYIESLLGQGAFGEVYLVTHLGLKVKRAVKVLRRDAPGLGSSDFADYRARFQLEAELGARLNTPNSNPHLLQVHNYEEKDEVLLLEMEYAPGGSLAQRIQATRQQRTFLPVEAVVQMGQQVAQGLAALHALDIVHRDLKPANILFDDRGFARLADLGLAQVHGADSLRSQLSNPKPHPGTPAYMSPEQRDTFAYLPPATDVYALGLVLFEAITGRAYPSQRPGTRAGSLRPEVPAWLDELLARMMAEVPQDRPWHGDEAAELLEKGLAEETTRQAQEEHAKEAEQAALQQAAEEQSRREAEQAVRRAEQARQNDLAAETARQEAARQETVRNEAERKAWVEAQAGRRQAEAAARQYPAPQHPPPGEQMSSSERQPDKKAESGPAARGPQSAPGPVQLDGQGNTPSRLPFVVFLLAGLYGMLASSSSLLSLRVINVLNLSQIELSTLYMVLVLGTLIGLLLGGALAARRSVRSLMIAGWAAAALALLVNALANTLVLLYPAWLGLGLGLGLLSMVLYLLVLRHTSGNPKLLLWFGFSLALGGMISVGLYGLIYDKFGSTPSILLFFTLAFLGAMLSWRVGSSAPSGSTGGNASLRGLGLPLALAALLAGVLVINSSYSAIYMINVLGLTASKYSSYGVVALVAAAVAYLLYIPLLGRWKPRRLLTIYLVLSLLCVGMLLFTSSPGLAGIGLVGAAFLLEPLFILVLLSLHSSQQTSNSAITSFLVARQLGGLGVSLLAGTIINVFGLRSIFGLACVLILLALALAWRWSRQLEN